MGGIFNRGGGGGLTTATSTGVKSLEKDLRSPEWVRLGLVGGLAAVVKSERDRWKGRDMGRCGGMAALMVSVLGSGRGGPCLVITSSRG